MRRKVIAVFVFQLSLLLLSFSAAMGGDMAAAGEGANAKVGFIGAETCQECHEDQYASYAKSVHFKKSIKGPQSQDACETCHGPGAMHVEKGGGRDVDVFAFTKDVDPEARSARCLACHYRTPGMDLWEMGVHKRNDLSCDSCHTIHNNGLQTPKQPDVCFDCHRDAKVAINKRSHHPILEGKMTCTSCHTPHGSMNKGMVKSEDAQMLCFTCHADKRGPFVWEHPPVEENCQSCHTPHGSIHARLLNERIPQVCQNCHDWSRHPGTPYDDAVSKTSGSRWYCLRCHTAIHGSSSPSGSGAFFIR